MARVTYGGGVTEYKGSIGGVTYQQNASGYIAKLRSRPTVNPSPDQNTYQNNLATLVAFWPTLTQVQKDTWNTFAAANTHTTPWGDIKTLSGYQWFLSCNLNRLLLFALPISTAPAWTSHTPPQTFTLVAAAGYLRVEWVPDYDPTYYLKFHITLPLRQSAVKLRRSLFYVGYRAPGAPTANYDITAWFESLANVTWATFFSTADASIICRVLHGEYATGLFSAFTSAIVKVS